MASAGDLESDIRELKALRSTALRPRVQLLLDNEIRAVEAEVTKLQAMKQATAPPSTISSSAGKVPVELKTFGWDESDAYVNFYVSIPDALGNFATAQSNLRCTDDSAVLTVTGDTDYKLSIGPLFAAIDPSSSTATLKPTSKQVLVRLKKKSPGRWEDWKKKVEKFKPPTTGPDADPSASLMTMMKQLYEEGDDEMKRTMAKAFHESRMGKGSSDPLGAMGSMGAGMDL